jgi:hypothetical protein
MPRAIVPRDKLFTEADRIMSTYTTAQKSAIASPIKSQRYNLTPV